MGNGYIKSPLNYTGGKYKLLSQITPLFPENIKTFVDLFCGGGNVGINVNSNKVLMNDIQPQLIQVLQWMKENTYEEINKKIMEIIQTYNLSLTSIHGYEYYGCDSSGGVAKYNKEKYIKLREDYNTGEKSPHMFYTMLLYAFNNQIRFNNKGEFNMPVNKRDYNDSIKKNLKQFVDKLNSTEIIFTNNDFRKLKVDKLSRDDFVYIDPPYLITLAAYNENGGWCEKDEKDLYDLCDELNNENIKFAVSNVTHHKGKQNDILIEWSKKYNLHSLNHSYSNSNYQTKDKSDNASLEVLITNY